MKIVYISNARIPTEKAHGVQIMKMCEAFVRKGADVTLIVPRRFNYIKDDPFVYYGIEKKFEIVRLSTIDTVFLGRFGFLLQYLSFAVTVLLWGKWKSADIVYTRDEFLLYPMLHSGKKVFFEAHMPRFNFVIRLILKRIGKIITISKGLKDFYVSKGFSENSVLVAPDGVDLKNFSITADKNEVRKSLNLPLEKKLVMYIGRLDKWKGVQTLLEASLLLKDAQIVIVGEGSKLKEFQNKYTSVIFMGPLPYKDLPRNQQAADVLVIPNSGKSDISRLYTSPLKVFAHMASGVPIVASDLPSIREVLNEKNSLLVKPDNEEALAESIKRVINDTDLSVQCAHQAKEDVKQYSWERRAESILSFMES